MKNRLLAYFKKPEYIALLVSLTFGIVSAILVPQMTVNDEGAHLLKAYHLSEGNFSGKVCEFPRSILNEAGSSPERVPATSSSPIDYHDKIETTCGSAAGYSPIMHIPQSFGVTVAKILNGSPDLLVLFGRIANVVFYAVCLFFIIRIARLGKWVYLVIGLFPLMIHTAGSLSADTVNNLAVMFSIAFIINLFVQKGQIERGQVGVLLGLAALLALTKPTNLILLLPLAALPSSLFKSNDKKLFNPPFNYTKWLTIVCVLAVGVATTLLLHKVFGSMLVREYNIENPLVQDPLRFFSIAYNTYLNPTLGYGDLLVRGLVGEFSSFRYHLPTVVVFLEMVALCLALLTNWPLERRIRVQNLGALSLLCTVSLLLLVAAITVALYSAWAILPKRLGVGAFYADGVQGRYFTAALSVLIPVFVWLRQWIRLEFKKESVAYGIILTISLSSLLFVCA